MGRSWIRSTPRPPLKLVLEKADVSSSFARRATSPGERGRSFLPGRAGNPEQSNGFGRAPRRMDRRAPRMSVEIGSLESATGNADVEVCMSVPFGQFG